MRNLPLWVAMFFSVAMIILASWTAFGEPAQFEQADGQTRVYLDIHNRSWLAVEEVNTLLVFYDAAGDECHRELVYINFETPIRPQGHEEIFITIPDVSRFGATRVEVDFRY